MSSVGELRSQRELARQIDEDFQALLAELERSLASYSGSPDDAGYLCLKRARDAASRGVELCRGLIPES